ncbi:IBR domain protein [Pelomyxa schiedti]|nr:IBR domain protein [Pelomyxa schiedti]
MLTDTVPLSDRSICTRSESVVGINHVDLDVRETLFDMCINSVPHSNAELVKTRYVHVCNMRLSCKLVANSPEQSPSTAAPPQPLYREVYYTVPAPSPPHPLSPVPSPSSSTSTSTLPQPTVNNVSPTENPTTVNYSSAARRMPQRAYVPPTPSSFDPIVPHPTKTAKSENKDDDYKLALSLQPQNCPLCLDDVDVDEMHTLSCGHSYCRQCLARYFQELINSKQLPISCPDPSCKREILEKDIELLIPRELVEKMQNFLLDCTFERNRDYSCCPSPDCGYVFIYEEGDPIDFTCPKCHKRYCLRCRVEMHAGQTCESYQQWAKMNSKDTFNNFVKGAKYKQCPQCRCWIELAKGCNHMTCKCGHEFCYSCGKSFPCGCGQDPHAPGFRPNNFSAAIYAPWVLFKGLQRMLGMGGQEQQPQPQPEPEDTSSPHSDSVSEEERTTSAARRPDADRGSPPPSSRDNCQPPSLQPASPFMRQPGPLQTIPNTPAAAAVTPMATTLERAPPHPLMLNNPLAQFSKPYGRGEPLPAFMFGNQPTHAPTPITISTESQPITVEDTAQTQSQPSDPLTQNLLKGIEESKERMLLALRQQQQQQQQKFDYGPSNKL